MESETRNPGSSSAINTRAMGFSLKIANLKFCNAEIVPGHSVGNKRGLKEDNPLIVSFLNPFINFDVAPFRLIEIKLAPEGCLGDAQYLPGSLAVTPTILQRRKNVEFFHFLQR